MTQAALVFAGLVASLGSLQFVAKPMLAEASRVKPEAPAAKGSAMSFLRGVVNQLVDDHYAEAWRTLHPAQQSFAAQDEYVACESRDPIPGVLSDFRVNSAWDESFTVPGTKERVIAKTVVAVIEIRDMASGEVVPTKVTLHAVAVEGRWRWVLPADRASLYRSDSCRSATSGPPTNS
jgi:hypothetical protein